MRTWKRPADAAKKLGISLSQFWWLAANDPIFPPLTKLSPRVTVVEDAKLDAYVDAKSGVYIEMLMDEPVDEAAA